MSGRCPSCNAPASGKFCGQCGARLGAAACTQCGAALQPGARFCAACGTPVGAEAGTPPGRQRRPGGCSRLRVAAGAGLVVVLIALYRTQSPAAAPAPAGQEAPFAGSGGGTPPDLSKMTPREAFDRLFNRVMTASENGDTASANRFTPMAIMAYGNLSDADADARYDVALIKLHVG